MYAHPNDIRLYRVAGIARKRPVCSPEWLARKQTSRTWQAYGSGNVMALFCHVNGLKRLSVTEKC